MLRVTVFIVNGFFVTEKSAGTLWSGECCAFELQSLTFHPLCPDHANDKKSVARGTTRPFYHHQISRPECQRVISGLHGGDARPNHHLALRRSHLAISVCQADSGVKPNVQDGSAAHAAFPDYKPERV